ncbi:shikimate dehydrogenase [Pelagibius sp.]|uniref:shikimate dehydrogenase n=1 Tax=Pelagibius sp. TaxID=1931238 RepID=UPI00262F5C31|nr:shikimate dehydrogenase [Pelagibius sp.]
MILSGKAALAGVIGWPIGHSLSPRLHGFWLDHYGIDGAYLPLSVAPDNLESALRGLRDAGFRGVNVTIPHKESVMALCDRVDDTARRIGAVNTLIFDADGIQGSNSDAFGFFENLKAAAPDYEAAAGPALLLGAGGAARAVAVALLDAGLAELRICNRSAERAERLAAELGSGAKVVSWDHRAAALDDLGLLVNSTSLGMTGQPPLALDLDRLAAGAVVYDLVYAPLETPLLADARTRGARAVDGLGMLLHQARPGFAAWFGVEPKVTAALRDFVLQDG